MDLAFVSSDILHQLVWWISTFFFSGEFFPSTVLKSMILWRLSLYYTFTASTDSAHPNRCSYLAAMLLEDMTIMPSSCNGMWPPKLTSFIIPLAEDRTRPEAEFCFFFFRKQTSCGFWGWGFLCVLFQQTAGWYETICWILWAFHIAGSFPSGHLEPPKNLHQQHRLQVEREDSARGTGDIYYVISKKCACESMPGGSCTRCFSVFVVGLWFHTSRVLWKMLRLTLFREGPSCKVMCSLSHGARNIPRYFHTTTRWVLQVRNIFEYTLVQRPSNPVGNLKNGLVGSVWVGGYHWTLQ